MDVAQGRILVTDLGVGVCGRGDGTFPVCRDDA